MLTNSSVAKSVAKYGEAIYKIRNGSWTLYLHVLCNRRHLQLLTEREVKTRSYMWGLSILTSRIYCNHVFHKPVLGWLCVIYREHNKHTYIIYATLCQMEYNVGHITWMLIGRIFGVFVWHVQHCQINNMQSNQQKQRSFSWAGQLWATIDLLGSYVVDEIVRGERSYQSL
jgi:hypothetical protein